ncbi:class I SAM-dependent methyltransferase [Saccharibacillus alkalitolerans]|uniref:Methyltransferase domain-containing protein n=1 Tax=Saccharibacillus alkalitolerans TaxID=2705290 RepID=A0ABX0F656_9BACL|nr:class I SAM-dependent methyltransferase [Saccharibacillus alkalitolerans]NGZ75935.1 methyltransferase domain-containing protein [Saccharibacillus alkalitolerans]
MGFVSVLNFAQQLIQKRLQPGESAIDATVGTGADTLFLARTAGARGRVYGFDIQQEALDQARARLEREREGGAKLAAPELLLRSHAEMAEALPPELRGRVGAVMFNLGYLPGAEDLSVMTAPASTLPALEAALSMLRPKGILTAVLYPGHAGGGAEALAVERWAGELPGAAARVILYRQPQRPEAPYLIAIEKV